VVAFVVAGVVSVIFTFLSVPNKLDPRLKRAIAVGLAVASLTTAIATVPRTLPALPVNIHTVGPPVNGDPIAAKVWFDNPSCEGYAIEPSLLKSLPNLDELDTRWVYSHGGATTTWGEVLIEGATEPTVKLEGIRVVELERQRPVPNAVELLPCSPLPRLTDAPGFDVILAERPAIRPRPVTDENGKEMPPENFPIKVSNDGYRAILDIFVSGPPCLCSWKLALDWSTPERSGTTILDTGFGKIRTDTSVNENTPSYFWSTDGGWYPRLPK
jgi:hypothetical protein